MITSEKFWHDNQARNQREEKGGDWTSLFINLKGTLILLPYFSHLWIIFFLFKEQLLQYLGQKLRRFSLWKIFRHVDKVSIKIPLFHKTSHALKISWLPAW